MLGYIIVVKLIDVDGMAGSLSSGKSVRSTGEVRVVRRHWDSRCCGTEVCKGCAAGCAMWRVVGRIGWIAMGVAEVAQVVGVVMEGCAVG